MRTSMALPCLVAMAATALFIADSAWAQQTGGVQIQGNTTINATAQQITNDAENNSTADVGVGRINGNTTIKGNTTINATAQQITNTAKNNSKACVDVGTIGTNACEASTPAGQ